MSTKTREPMKSSSGRSLTVAIFAVGNGDCLVVEFPDNSLAAIDFNKKISPLTKHPLVGLPQKDAPQVHFLCLTHPHLDHLAGMDSIIPAAASRQGCFLHSVPSFERVFDAYTNVSGADTCDRHIEQEVNHLLLLANGASHSFDKHRIHSLNATTTNPLPLKHCDVEISLLGPPKTDADRHGDMLTELIGGLRRSLSHDLVNSISVTFQISYAGRKLIFAGDAMENNWRQITGRGQREGAIIPLGVDAVMLSHHGSHRSFYPELLDDLFGECPGQIIVSADGTMNPSPQVLEAIRTRHRRGIMDEFHCTGPVDMSKRSESFLFTESTLLDVFSERVAETGRIAWGDITLRIDESGEMLVSQQDSYPGLTWSSTPPRGRDALAVRG